MQLNFISYLNTLFAVSLGTGRSLFELNSRVVEQLLENNQALLQSTITANGEMLEGSKAKFLESGKAAGRILVDSRGRYESWAVESAGQLGTAARLLTTSFHERS